MCGWGASLFFVRDFLGYFVQVFSPLPPSLSLLRLLPLCWRNRGNEAKMWPHFLCRRHRTTDKGKERTVFPFLSLFARMDRSVPLPFLPRSVCSTGLG